MSERVALSRTAIVDHIKMYERVNGVYPTIITIPEAALADVAQFHEHRPPRPVPPEKLCGLVLVVVEEDIPDPGFRLSR